MIGHISRKSKTYHRKGCCYINKIDPKHLVVFDFEDGRIKEYNPCKHCCDLKTLYKECIPKLESIFNNLDVSISFEGDFIRVCTQRYNFRIYLNSDSQNFELFYEKKSKEDAILSRSFEIDKIKKLQTVLKFIANKEKLAVYPAPYRQQAMQIIQFANENNIEIKFDENTLYIITDVAAWKIVYNHHKKNYKLYHSPFGGKKITIKDAKKARYHIQYDCSKGTPYVFVRYVVEHDNAKVIEEDNFRKLPQKTKKQKKYYKQAEKRAIKKSIKRVNNIFKELDLNKIN